MSASPVENELDIRGLFATFWRQKHWIIGFTLLCMFIAWINSLLVKQEWSATAITDRPTVTMLGSYYAQRQFLHDMDNTGSNVTLTSPPPSIMDEVYQEFIMQLSSWDTRREFWLQTSYYNTRRSGNAKKDAVLLDNLINNIWFTPADSTKNINDSVRLVAETALDANNLLRQYVAFASEQTARYLNAGLTGDWAARVMLLKAQIRRQEEVANSLYHQRLRSVEQAVKIAQQHGLTQAQEGVTVEKLPDSELYLLGSNLLQAQLENLQASGPDYGLAWQQNKALLSTMEAGPVMNNKFQTYRYLRTPEEPVKRDSPNLLLRILIWGILGALAGACVALVRRRTLSDRQDVSTC